MDSFNPKLRFRRISLLRDDPGRDLIEKSFETPIVHGLFDAMAHYVKSNWNVNEEMKHEKRKYRKIIEDFYE